MAEVSMTFNFFAYTQGGMILTLLTGKRHPKKRTSFVRKAMSSILSAKTQICKKHPKEILSTKYVGKTPKII